jgi:tetratricopeptide (TPR) repeat protein
MKKTTIFIVTIIFSFQIAHSRIAFSGEIFINTDPIGAEVFVGKEFVGHTPFRTVDGWEEPSKKLQLKKDGYEEVEIELMQDDERTVQIYYTLFSPYVDFVLSQREKNIYVNEVSAGRSPLVIKNIPNGIYEIESESDRISISNAEYTQQRRTTLLETIFSAGGFAASLGGMIYYENNGNSSRADALSVSSIIFGGLLSYNLLKFYKIGTSEKRDRAQMSAIEISHTSAQADREMFTVGMELVGKEYWNDALTKFNLLVNIHPESRYVPISVYEIGYIYYTLGQYDEAAKNFRAFIYEYPVVEFYSYGVYYLIDSELQKGDVIGAMEDYKNIRPFYIDDASGTLYRDYYNLFEKLYVQSGQTDNQILKDLMVELNYFLDNYQDAYSYPDVLFLKGSLSYRYLNRQSGVEIFDFLRNNFSHRQELIKEMESLLNAG